MQRRAYYTLFILAMLLDMVVTMFGIRAFGLSAEANLLIRFFVASFGPFAAFGLIVIIQYLSLWVLWTQEGTTRQKWSADIVCAVVALGALAHLACAAMWILYYSGFR